jgi:hypothetical protein
MTLSNMSEEERDAKIDFQMDPYRIFREDARRLARKILLTSELSDEKLKEFQVIAKTLIPKLEYVPEGTEF